MLRRVSGGPQAVVVDINRRSMQSTGKARLIKTDVQEYKKAIGNGEVFLQVASLDLAATSIES